jgi:protein-tyrosine kinase
MKKQARKPMLITQQHPRSEVAEAYRMLRTNLNFASVDRPHRSLLVTSATAECGKTTTSANLAIVLAQAGESVLLVDCDLRQPSVHKTLDLDNRQGLSNVLVQDCDPLEMAQKGPVDRLTVLTSGPLPPNPAELLGSRRLRALWPRLLERFDRLIIDSPPILAVTDSVLLAAQVDGVILVVWSGTDRMEAVKEAKHQLLAANADIIGVVLNKVKLKVPGYYYSYSE